MAARHSLFTTGYSGHSPATFLELLREHDIEVVVDVRRNPVSRKKGFSRTALCAFLNDNDLEYTHLKDLGVPQPLRIQLRDGDCDLSQYLADFAEYLKGKDSVLKDVYEMAMNKRCCLLCVEEHHHECHRSVVANQVAARNGRAVNITHI